MPIWIAINSTSEPAEVEGEETLLQKQASPNSWKKWREAASNSLRRAERKIQSMVESEHIEEIDEALTIFTNIMIRTANKTLRKSTNESPIVLALREDQELLKLKKEEKDARKKFNTSITKSNKDTKECQQKIYDRKKKIIKDKMQTRWEDSRERIRRDPAQLFKMLKKTGKKATRSNDKPFTAQVLGDKIVADGEGG